MNRGAAVGLSVLAALLGMLQLFVLVVVVAVANFDENFLDVGFDGGGFGTGGDVAQLTEDCLGGDMVACDTLYLETPVGSDGEFIGETCGNRNDPAPAQCEIIHGAVFDPAAEIGIDAVAAFGYGDDPELDLLWDGCVSGDMLDCDDLFFQAPVGSEYESFGESCGDRVEAVDSRGLCADLQTAT